MGSQTNAENNKRIARNTIVLYIRMVLTMAVSIYTSRIILMTLGVENYGIYNVVGSVVTMFSFLNAAMATATQRFLSFEIGRKDYDKLQKIFSLSLTIHILIAIIIILLAETIGLYLLNTEMNFPANRIEAARWIYHFSILTFAVSVIQVPYNASILSNEKMDVYAYISIAEVSCKLIIVYMLKWLEFDKLKLYAILIFSVSIMIAAIYRTYCKHNFKECHYNLLWDKSLFLKLLNFSGWNLLGNLSWMTMGQGLNILLNIFFGPIVNAAWGIAYQINGAVALPINNIRIAINPQIVKAYARNDIEYMNILVFESAKYTYYLLLFLALPIILETKTILHIWLNIVPNYAIIFCQLILINTLIQSFDASFGILFQAIGKIKENQLFASMSYLLVLPTAYILLKFGHSPEIVFYVQITATIIVAFVVKFLLLIFIAGISAFNYFKLLILPVIKVSLCSIIVPIILKLNVTEGNNRLFFVAISSFICVTLSVYFFGISNATRLNIKRFIPTTINNID